MRVRRLSFCLSSKAVSLSASGSCVSAPFHSPSRKAKSGGRDLVIWGGTGAYVMQTLLFHTHPPHLAPAGARASTPPQAHQPPRGLDDVEGHAIIPHAHAGLTHGNSTGGSLPTDGDSGGSANSLEAHHAASPAHSLHLHDGLAAPTVVSSSHAITSEAGLTAIVDALEEKRLARQKKSFDDMIVFEGGALKDHASLGNELIMRDFIQFALYHHKWGYYPKLFRKYRQLMTTGYFDPIPFSSLRNQHDYERYVSKFHESTPAFITPTQLFQPYYGWVVADYLVSTWRAKFDPREPLVVYDVGSGTGALAVSILDYLSEQFPDAYERCEFHVIEQNAHMIPILRNRLVHHYHRVKIHHTSMLNWHALEKRRCMVLAIELFSGLPHDCVVWDGEGAVNEQWFFFQQHDNLSTTHERFFSVQDPMILRYLRYLNWMQEESFHALKVLCATDGRDNIDAPRFRSIEPQTDDPLHLMVSKALWIHSPFRTAWLPTAQMILLEKLAQFFPRHHLFAADWSSVRQGLPGVNGPVLQVKMRIAKDVYLRRPVDALNANAGMVDICFPTDFEHLGVVYGNVCGREKEIASMPHPEFWKTFGGDKTALYATRSGYNPLIEDFKLFHVFATHHPAEL